MKFFLSVIFAALAVGALLFSNSVAAPLTGLEKTVVEVSGGIIAGVMFLLFVIFSVVGIMNGHERCDECGRPTDPRLAYLDEPNTKNPPCNECKRPLPDSQWNA